MAARRLDLSRSSNNQHTSHSVNLSTLQDLEYNVATYVVRGYRWMGSLQRDTVQWAPRKESVQRFPMARLGQR